MKIAYIAGAYRSKWGKLGIAINVLKARKVAKQVWKLGYVALCPHMNSALMDGTVPDEMFLQGGLELLSKCDLMVVFGKYWLSKGTVAEIWCAMELKMPIWEIDLLEEAKADETD